MRKVVFIFFMACQSLFSQIAVDGFYNDWKITDFQIQDDGDNNLLDITRVWVSNDDENLYIRIDANREFDIQDSEDISIFIDADNTSGTGFEVNGIGSEISYYFGNRQAFVNYPNDFLATNHAGIGMIALPTITSSTFEFVFKRNVISSKGEITMNETISISVENGSNGDEVPNNSGGFEYTMQENERFTSEYSLLKTSESYTRVMSYNILRDGFQEQSQKSHLEAIVKAINPDIIAFQEIYDTPLSTIRSFLNEELPNSDGSSWDFAKEGPDVVVFARGIIEAHDNIDGNGVFLLYDNAGENPVILYNVHLPCCDNDSDRQREIDRIMSVVRDKEGASEVNFSYEEDVPIIITGDFNMVGKSQNLKSFIEGDIDNESSFGQDFGPDWDGSNLEDANPYVTGFPSNYTWRSNNSSYNPGKLDFIFFSGSVMTQENGFVLATEFLSDEELSVLNLNKNSTGLASDHLPVVVDFILGLQDIDMDGFTTDVDCDDMDAAVNPEADEIANNDVDEDCDGIALVIDEDMDGFNSDEDCDDGNPAVNPGADEIPNNDVDENCDGIILIVDVDMDGFNSDEDCDDTNASINPAAEEIVNNDVDENCDGFADEIDDDMDGFNSDEDCDDSNAEINPGTVEIPNNDVDENCDGELGVVDSDMDGFTSDVDCNDMDAAINPETEEIPNNDVDENCDGVKLVIDEDMDGYNSDEDCDDGNPAVNPGAEEIPNNGVDEDCDGEDLISGVEDLQFANVEIYPNPVDEWLFVDVPAYLEFDLAVYDVNGHMVTTLIKSSGIKRINVSHLAKGFYILRISDSAGGFAIKSFVKR